MHISLAAEVLGHIWGFPITNTLVTAWIVMGVFIIGALLLRRSLSLVPTGIQNVMETVFEAGQELVEPLLGKEMAKKAFPLLVTFFLFIVLSNWFGIFPGFGTIGFYKIHEGEREFLPLLRSVYADLNMTVAIAVISVVMTQVFGFMANGAGYLKRYFNFSNPVLFFVGLLEIVSEFAKIISFAFRLFGNIFAGEVLLMIVGFIAPFLAPLPFYGLELFVGLIQAVVFTMLTLVFFSMATSSHH
ncbi:F0F1 ATP synthase subunit A [Candidatus Uhrbacteria bacterium]|nr:F0F1 ATP synthase subunit A [Candidatus Uhrbacteria bacterium]